MIPLKDEYIRAIEAIEAEAWEDMAKAAPPPFARAVGLETARLGRTLLLLAQRIPLFQFNWLSGAGLLEDDSSAIAEAVHRFRQGGVERFFIQIPQSPRSDAMRMSARKAGLEAHRLAWAKFHRETASPPEVQTRLDIREVGIAQRSEFAATALAGFGMPQPMAAWLEQLPGRANWHCYVAYDGAVPIAAAALYVRGDHGWLGIGATRPEARKRGSQSALLARRIADAGKFGARFVTTETGVPQQGEPAPSYANIKKAGFEVAYVRENWTLPSST
ncbi:MAG TPA: hypothetical protein VG891_05370 [Rhizomicrobium sp.]|nr:hypothetical protein [Rhizomicrobium sp.]